MAGVALCKARAAWPPVGTIYRDVAVNGERSDAKHVVVLLCSARWDDLGDVESGPIRHSVPDNLWVDDDVVGVEQVGIEALVPFCDHLLKMLSG